MLRQQGGGAVDVFRRDVEVRRGADPAGARGRNNPVVSQVGDDGSAVQRFFPERHDTGAILGCAATE